MASIDKALIIVSFFFLLLLYCFYDTPIRVLGKNTKWIQQQHSYAVELWLLCLDDELQLILTLFVGFILRSWNSIWLIEKKKYFYFFNGIWLQIIKKHWTDHWLWCLIVFVDNYNGFMLSIAIRRIDNVKNRWRRRRRKDLWRTLFDWHQEKNVIVILWLTSMYN